MSKNKEQDKYRELFYKLVAADRIYLDKKSCSVKPESKKQLYLPQKIVLENGCNTK